MPSRAGAVADRDQHAEDREPVKSDQECGQRHAESIAGRPRRRAAILSRSDRAAFCASCDGAGPIRSAGRRHAHIRLLAFAAVDARADAFARAATRAISSSRTPAAVPPKTDAPAPRNAGGGRHDATAAGFLGRTLRPPCAWALRFSKMHGLGNDFVIVDCRDARAAARCRGDPPTLGDRHFGVGFDQLLTIERASDASCAFAYGIWNTDGSTARPVRQRRALRRALARARRRARRGGCGAARKSVGSGCGRTPCRRPRARRHGRAALRAGRDSARRR